MALFRKLFYKKPPDGLLEISERVYVFDCCFTTDTWEIEDYKGYVGNIVGQLREHYPDSSILVFNFREGEVPSQIATVLSEYDMTIMDYPRQYEGCPLLSMEVIHHFLRSSESWLSLGQQNVLLMHCERGGWPVLAFMLAALLIYRKHYTGEYKTLDMVYKQAPRELLQFLSPLNPLPSQLRYLQYVSRRNVATEWPPLDRALTLDCVIIRMIPDFDGSGGCCPIFRIYGQDPFLLGNKAPKLLFSTPRKSKNVRHYKQAECELVKIDINCNIQGDIVLECISLHDDMEREKMMFRAMFNTAFIRSNILMLNREEIDTLWDAKDQFPKDFRAEVLFSEMDAADSVVPVNLSCFEEKEGLPMEAFAKVQEIFSNVDWLAPRTDAALNVLHQIAVSDIASLENRQRISRRSSELVAFNEEFHNLGMEKPSSPGTDGGRYKAQSQIVGPRSDSDLLQLPLPVPPPPPQPSLSQASPEVATGSISSLPSLPPHDLTTHEAMQPSLPKRLDPHLSERVTASKIGPPLPVEMPPSGTMQQSSLSYPLAPLDSQIPLLPSMNEKPVSGSKPSMPTPASLPPSAASIPSPPNLPSKTLVIDMKQSPFPPSILPASPPIQKTTDVKVGTSPPATPPATGPLTQSPFPPSIMPPSPSISKDNMDTKTGTSQSLPSSPIGPLTPPLKEKRGTVLGPPQQPPSPQTLPSPTTPNDKGIISGPHPAPPPDSTSIREDQALESGMPSTSLREDQAVITEMTSSPQAVPGPPGGPESTIPPALPVSVTPATPPAPPVSVAPPAPPIPPVKPAIAPPLPPPPPPPPPPSISVAAPALPVAAAAPPPPPPPPPPPTSVSSPAPQPKTPAQAPRPPPRPPSPPAPPVKAAPAPPIPPPPPTPLVKEKPAPRAGPSPPPPPPPPLRVGQAVENAAASSVPPPPPPPAPNSSSVHLGSASQVSSSPPPPPPPAFSANGSVKPGVVPPPPPSLSRGANVSGAPSPPPPLLSASNGKGRNLSRSVAARNQQTKKLKPLHWLKLTRAVQGSLWAEAQKSGEASKAPEIDLSELESLFSAANPSPDQGSVKSKSRASVANKPEKVQLIEHRRAYNCEIMLSKVKIPLHELMDSVLALEDSAMDVDQVDNLIKFCPTKEEMELLKGYKGEKDKLGKCEQFFLELMKVPRTESKLRVFSFKLQFGSQVSDLRKSLNIVNSAVEQIRSSAKLKRVMQTILSLGNALNQGTARGSAIGFRLDSLLKLTETRARNNRMTLMHYLCKVLSDKLPEVLDFSKDLSSLEPATKIQLKYLAEEMQAISKGLEKVVQELSMAENDGPVSENFRKALKEFLCTAEGEARSLASLYSGVGKNVDALILYFGEDPARCPYEQVVSTLLNFVRMFNQANEENSKQLDAERKKAEKEAANEKLKLSHSRLESELIRNPPIKSVK